MPDSNKVCTLTLQILERKALCQQEPRGIFIRLRLFFSSVAFLHFGTETRGDVGKPRTSCSLTA